MTAERWQTTHDQLNSLGILRAPVNPASTYTLNFFP
jgi:hypothetical protein